MFFKLLDCMSCEMKTEIVQFFIRIFIDEKPNVKKFIRDYLNFIEIYSNMPNFIRFNKKIPVLKNLRPESRSLIVVYFENEQERFFNTSVFPICLFTIYYKHKTAVCRDSMNLLLLYLEIANIETVSFHGYDDDSWKDVMQKIKQYNHQIKCYPPTSFHYFCKFNKIKYIR